MYGNYDKLAERYGVERGSIMKPDAPNRQEEMEKYRTFEKRLADAAMNDYDTRRSLEAAALSGDKKAKKLSKKGFRNAEDVQKANDMFKKMHKKDMGNGGDFSSNRDFAGLTNYLVNKDRDTQTQGYDDKYATKSALEEAMAKVKAGGATEVEKPPEKSEQTIKDEAAVKHWEDNYAMGGIYGGADNAGTDAGNVYGGKNQAGANALLDKYKKDLFQDEAALMPEI